MQIFDNLTYIFTTTFMKTKLIQLLEDNKWNITGEVIKEALDYDSPKEFFEDLLQHWCISWMVGSLIYYKDTHEFFERHYEEIEEIRAELEEQWLEIKIPSNSDLKNFLAWLGFEERARELYDELELDR